MAKTEKKPQTLATPKTKEEKPIGEMCGVCGGNALPKLHAGVNHVTPQRQGTYECQNCGRTWHGTVDEENLKKVPEHRRCTKCWGTHRGVGVAGASPRVKSDGAEIIVRRYRCQRCGNWWKVPVKPAEAK